MTKTKGRFAMRSMVSVRASAHHQPVGASCCHIAGRQLPTLRQRIELRAEQVMGRGVLDRIGACSWARAVSKAVAYTGPSVRVEFNNEFGDCGTR